MTPDELYDLAIAHYKLFVNKHIRVNAAYVSNDNGNVDTVNFDPPLLVKVTDELLPEGDIILDGDEDEPWCDAMYPVDCLEPERLPPGTCVAWINGPTFHWFKSIRIDWEEFTGEEHG
jgi:hypothetical protein